MDTTETVHPNKPAQAYGKEAPHFLNNLIKGEQVYVESKPNEKTDKYGRALYYVYRAPDGLFVNHKIVRLGHVSRARITQIMNLLHLAPDIQEDILFLPKTDKGRGALGE